MTSSVNTDLLSSLGLLQNSTQSKTSNSSSTQSSNQLGQQDFLQLMITQLKNQDPTKPLDSGNFLSQMAEFSTVSGIGDLQTSFQTLANSLSSNEGLQASSLVGHSVAVPSSVGILTGAGGMQGAVDVPSGATDVVVDVTDRTGQVIKQLDLGSQSSGLAQFTWDGTTSTGATAAPGEYSIKATGLVGGQQTALNTYAVDSVSSVTLNNDGSSPTLNLGSLGPVDFISVKQIM